MCDCNHDELRSVTRLQNRALRTVNRLLRRRQEQIQAETDKVVAALFDAPTEADLALHELWENGKAKGWLSDCDPQDYQEIVKQYIAMQDFVEKVMTKVRNKVQTEHAVQGVAPTSVSIDITTSVLSPGVAVYEQPQYTT